MKCCYLSFVGLVFMLVFDNSTQQSFISEIKIKSPADSYIGNTLLPFSIRFPISRILSMLVRWLDMVCSISFRVLYAFKSLQSSNFETEDLFKKFAIAATTKVL